MSFMESWDEKLRNFMNDNENKKISFYTVEIISQFIMYWRIIS